MKVPAGFLWGSATSAHQVEGQNILSDWWGWEQNRRVPEPSGAACDHYRRFESDLDLARSLGHNAYRFSLEWSRIEPSPGKFSEEALSHYGRVIQACRDRNLEPVVTLHHFTNPHWLLGQGGWVSPRAVGAFSRYVNQVAERYGDQVRWWVTINEPTVLVYYGYLLGTWPPGGSSIAHGAKALKNLLQAHRLAYQRIHSSVRASTGSARTVRVGLAHHMRCYDPCRPGSWQDRWSARLRGRIGNRWVLKKCAGTMDFIGLNYYTRDFVRWGGWHPAAWWGQTCSLDHHPQAGPKSGMGWEIYPEGFRRVLLELKEYGLPILVAENGVCAEEDRVRAEFISGHIEQMVKAMGQGVPVAGYLYWSLIDNFEWAQGFAPRFGLAEVDYATQERKVRPSALEFSRIIRTLS